MTVRPWGLYSKIYKIQNARNIYCRNPVRLPCVERDWVHAAKKAEAFALSSNLRFKRNTGALHTTTRKCFAAELLKVITSAWTPVKRRSRKEFCQRPHSYSQFVMRESRQRHSLSSFWANAHGRIPKNVVQLWPLGLTWKFYGEAQRGVQSKTRINSKAQLHHWTFRKCHLFLQSWDLYKQNVACHRLVGFESL